ncbi:MAG: GNAT family N-acetyltransferase [Novosphingobium sp.]|uniref:GNAT family N-acetyltransferase n=1 Tax=Novosphingobium sp. TaxID=1874826 RepID=UPI0032BC2180
MNLAALDRPAWAMLTGRQAHLALGDDRAVRIEPSYGPFAAARDGSVLAQAALAALVQPGEQIWLIEPEAVCAPPGLAVVRTAPLLQMIAQKPMPLQGGDEECQVLSEEDAGAMRELALATEPGPWGDKTRHYGGFYGIFREGQLAAMAGTRMRPAPGIAEVSAVCTWPEHRGQGLAARLIRRVMADFTQAGETPFLHSYAGNAKAIGLYETLGFLGRRSMVVTVLERR